MKLNFQRKSEREMEKAAEVFYEDIKQRRSVREFCSDPVDPAIIDRCILAAGTAPNGANLQPWHFSVITSDEVKQTIRSAAEEEEKPFILLVVGYPTEECEVPDIEKRSLEEIRSNH